MSHRKVSVPRAGHASAARHAPPQRPQPTQHGMAVSQQRTEQGAAAFGCMMPRPPGPLQPCCGSRALVMAHAPWRSLW